MTNKVEKGQKYKSEVSGWTYEILTDPFVTPHGVTLVAYWDTANGLVRNNEAHNWTSDNYTLIREPKFKVGDRVTHPHGGEVFEIVAISPDADPEGDFAHVLKSDDGWFCLGSRLKAAE